MLICPGPDFPGCPLNPFSPPPSQSLSAPADEMRSCTWALADIETAASTARTIAFTVPPLVWSGGLELRDRHRQPLYPVMAEVDLYACIAAVAFGVDDDAAAELGMHHVLPDAKAADVARRLVRHRGARLAREVGCKRLLPVESRREPLHQLLRNLFQDALRHVVARLAVQHARLRVRQVEAIACAGDRHIGQAPFL